MHSFFSRAPTHHSLTINSRFLYELKHKVHLFNRTTKLYFTNYSCVVIILLHKGLYKFVFSTDPFGKLVFCLSTFFTLCRIQCNLHKLYNICIIIVYIASVRYPVFLFSLISKKRYASFEYRYSSF